MTELHNKQYLKGINGLRILFAITLLLGHIPQPDFADWGKTLAQIPWPIGCAYAFFALSGFLAGFHSNRHTSVRSYYKKKAKRLLPLYYLYILVVIVVYFAFNWTDAIWNPNLLLYLFLLPEIPFCSSTGIIPLVHLWFIGVLVLFFLIFPLFTRIEAKKQSRSAIIICLLWFAIKVCAYLINKESFIYRFFGVVSMDCLFLGVFAGILSRNENAIEIKIAENRLISIIVWVLFLTSGIYGKFIPSVFRNEYIAIITVILILCVSSSRPIINLENRILNKLGAISYEIYVVQILTIILTSYLYSRLNLDLPGFAIYAICIIATLLVSWIFNKATSFNQPDNNTTSPKDTIQQ